MGTGLNVTLALVAGFGLVGPAAAQTQIWAPARVPLPRTAVPVRTVVPVIVRPPASVTGASAAIATPTAGVGAAAVAGRSGAWGAGLGRRSGESRSVTVTTDRAPGSTPGSRETRITVRDTTGVAAVQGLSTTVGAGAVAHRKGDQRIRVVERPNPTGGREIEVTVDSGRHAPPVEVPIILLVE
jgi:hypothetical protein